MLNTLPADSMPVVAERAPLPAVVVGKLEQASIQQEMPDNQRGVDAFIVCSDHVL